MLSSINSPSVARRVACGDYEFFSSVDIEWDELTQEAQHNGFVLDSTRDGHELVYTIEQMSPEEHAAYLAEEQELALENLKWQYSEG